MPCDRINEILEQDKDQVVWRQNQCVHQTYWNFAGGDILAYYALRQEIIKGMISHSYFQFCIEDNPIYIIKRR